jgi:hypothetical protein
VWLYAANGEILLKMDNPVLFYNIPIDKVCNGLPKRKTAGGFIWKYKEV